MNAFLDHTIVQNQARTLAALTDALTPPPTPRQDAARQGVAHRPAPVTSVPSPKGPQDVTGAIPSPRQLRSLYESFFTPRFRALEESDDQSDPTLAEVVEAGKLAAAWHDNEAKRAGDSEWAAYHRIRGEVIAQTIAPLDLLLGADGE